MSKRVAVLLSGGVDSIALCNSAMPTIAITIDYGQVCAKSEIMASQTICEALSIQHIVKRVDFNELGSGDLSGKPPIDIAPESEWWPFRNQMLITVAAMALVGHGVTEIQIGTVSSDSFHRDGTRTFVDAISQLLSLQEGGICVTAPALDMTSAELVRNSQIQKSLLAWAHSCHTSNFACGRCRGCFKHRAVFEELGYGLY